MKRTVLLLTAAAVAVTPLAASAAPPKPTKRTITFDHDGFSNVGAPGGTAMFNSSSVLPMCDVFDACWDFTTVKGEKTVEISTGDPTLGFQVWFDGTYADSVQTFCGKGKITVSPRSAHEVFVRPALDDCGGLNTGGTLTAVITGTK